MSYRWKPNASQRREFAIKMQDPEEKAAYEERKRFKNSYDGFKNKEFIPTKEQYENAFKMLNNINLTDNQKDACNQVIYGYDCQEKIHHDYIHIINEFRRSENKF